MREALFRITSAYSEIAGNSKIVVLFIVSMLAVILIDENSKDTDERRRINPTVFLLSLWSGVSYAVTRLLSGQKKVTRALGMLFFAVAVVLSGKLVFSESAYEASGFYEASLKIKLVSLVVIFVSLLISFLIARQIFNSTEEKTIFMSSVLLLHLFGYYSEKAVCLSLILKSVSVVGILFHCAFPLLLLIYLICEEKIRDYLKSRSQAENTDGENSEMEDYEEEWDMKKHKILNIRNMAIAMLAMIIVFLAAIFVLNNKINSLYDATVVLEKAAKSKMTVLELKNDEGDVTLTLMISPEGSVTAIDGQGRDNGEKCYDLISEYTDTVDKWYLYSDDGKNSGAYGYCREHGIIVKEAFIVSGIEKIE